MVIFYKFFRFFYLYFRIISIYKKSVGLSILFLTPGKALLECCPKNMLLLIVTACHKGSIASSLVMFRLTGNCA